MITISHDLVPLTPSSSVLRLHCSGAYPIGARGYPDAKRIYETGKELIKTTGAQAVLLDYTDFDYQWGDDLWLTFELGFPFDTDAQKLPIAVIVGDKCRDAIKTLLEDDRGYDSWLDSGFIFFDEPSAIEALKQASSTPGKKEMEFHLKRGEQLLGVLISRSTDFPWIICEFDPTESFKEVQPWFDEELNLLESDQMDAWQSSYERLNALGLRLIDTKNQKDIGQFLLHIRGSEAWFRPPD